MAHEIAIDEALNCYFVRWTGVVDASELRAIYNEIARLPWFRPGLNCLNDLRQADARVDQSDIWMFSDLQNFAGPMFGSGRVAAVVSDDRTYNLVRTMNTVTKSPERTREVFRDYEAAKAWLGLPADYVGPFEGSG